MDTKQYTGIWRSYKTFLSRGDVQYHDLTCYREVIITKEGGLTLKSFSTFTKKEVLKKDDWYIHIDGTRRFLYLEGRRAFEILTLEKMIWCCRNW